MIRRKPRLVLSALGVIFCLANSGCITPPPKPAPVVEDALDMDGKVLMMHYMPWYQTPQVRERWGSHWTGHQSQHDPDEVGEDGLPDIWSKYHPLIGLYDSTDPDVLECHLLQMKLAGVDGVIVDWYGIGNAADYPPIHDATRAMFEAAGRFGMKFSVCYEDRTIEYMVKQGHLQSDEVTHHLIETFQWMDAEWFHRPQYLHFLGGPLVLNFGPMYLRDTEPWDAARTAVSDPPTLFALHHLWKKAGGDGGFTWVHHDPFEGTPEPERIQQRLGEVFSYFSTNVNEVIVSAYPGFDDVYVNSHRTLDHREGETLRDTMTASMAGPWKIIQLVTWNDYGEGTIIEPTHEFGYTFLEIIQQARREERRAAFRFTAGDLRLPAQLLMLRKRNDLPAETLDGISDLLSAGDCEAARGLLARYTGT